MSNPREQQNQQGGKGGKQQGGGQKSEQKHQKSEGGQQDSGVDHSSPSYTVPDINTQKSSEEPNQGGQPGGAPF